MSEPYWSALGASPIDYKDEWSDSTQYAAGDVVVHNGVTYLAVNSSLGSTPPTVEEIFGGGDATPPGAIMAYIANSAPSGYLFCDGSAVSRATYAALFAVLGTTYGVGDGSTTFNLPEMRGRMLVGQGANPAVNGLGLNEGVGISSRRPQHRHTPHAHTAYPADPEDYALNGNSGGGSNFTGGSYGLVAANVNIGSNDGGSGVASDALDTPAYITVNWIIKT